MNLMQWGGIKKKKKESRTLEYNSQEVVDIFGKRIIFQKPDWQGQKNQRATYSWTFEAVHKTDGDFFSQNKLRPLSICI